MTTAAEFEQHRPRLTALAYRLTGRLADAEDAVQEAWLRLDAERSEIRDLGPWLSTVVGRICLDRVRSASARRERYAGPWLPEPVVTDVDARDPLELVVDRDELRMAALRVLHELSPDQRVAFVLHDGFDVPFAEIAELLDCPVPTARQHASRARRAMAEAPPRVPAPQQQEMLERFLAAVAGGDLDELTRLLHPRATLFGDSDGKAPTARRPVLGGEKIARFALGLAAKYGDRLWSSARPVLVNGERGLITPGEPEGTGTRRVAHRVVGFAWRDGLIAEIYDVVNPEKLGRVDFSLTEPERGTPRRR